MFFEIFMQELIQIFSAIFSVTVLSATILGAANNPGYPMISQIAAIIAVFVVITTAKNLPTIKCWIIS